MTLETKALVERLEATANCADDHDADLFREAAAALVEMERRDRDQQFRLNHFEPWLDPADESLAGRIVKRISPEGREKVLQAWDRARASIVGGNKGDHPRQIMEAELDADCDLLSEALAKVRELEGALGKSTRALRPFIRVRNQKGLPLWHRQGWYEAAEKAELLARSVLNPREGEK